jgi:hypothetical protein
MQQVCRKEIRLGSLLRARANRGGVAASGVVGAGSENLRQTVNASRRSTKSLRLANTPGGRRPTSGPDQHAVTSGPSRMAAVPGGQSASHATQSHYSNGTRPGQVGCPAANFSTRRRGRAGRRSCGGPRSDAAAAIGRAPGNGYCGPLSPGRCSPHPPSRPRSAARPAR